MASNLSLTNPWHSIAVGDNAPAIVNGIIEIPNGSKAKYELDKTSGLLKLDRVIYASMYYPANYGFIPQTLGDDHDPLDIVILSQLSITPLCIVRATVIGVMQMLDNGEGDDKILAVATDDVSLSHIHTVDELPAYFHSELQHFFQEYKALEHKEVKVEQLQGPKLAYEIIEQAMANYKQVFPK